MRLFEVFVMCDERRAEHLCLALASEDGAVLMKETANKKEMKANKKGRNSISVLVKDARQSLSSLLLLVSQILADVDEEGRQGGHLDKLIVTRQRRLAHPLHRYGLLNQCR